MKYIEKEFVCIQCPIGCLIKVKIPENFNPEIIKDSSFIIEGNKCPKGKEYVQKEVINPERTITTTVATIFKNYPRLPVKTDKEVPLKDIFKYMKEINKIVVKDEVKIGTIIKNNLLDSEINLVATSNIELTEKE